MNRMLLLILMVVLAGSLAACNSKDTMGENGQTEDAYVYEGPFEAKKKDRTFTLECTPENPAEGVVALNYYYNILGDYKSLRSAYGDNDTLQSAVKNGQKNAKEGYYIKDYTIHNLSTLSEETITNLFGDEIKEEATKYKLDSYEVVLAEFDMIWSDKGLDAGPQLGNGFYRWLYLCGKTTSDDAWKIYEFYWGEYYGL